jgi:integrase
MVELEIQINEILQQLKSELAHETWVSRRRYYNQMLKMAKLLNITKPCQELYNAFVADDNGSKERRSMHIRCVKLLDASAGTRAKNEQNVFYNIQDMPAEQEVSKFFQDVNLPLSMNASIEYMIVKAEIEMRYINHTVSTLGQYRHSWMEIRQYFANSGVDNYDEGVLQKYINENDLRRNSGFVKEWKWKMNRKAAYVLMEVAQTGSLRWGMIQQKKISCGTPAMDTLRQEYQNTIAEKNLSESSVYMHGYVFRKTAEFGEINKPEDLFSLSPNQIQQVITKFAEVCNKRSMSTILPILRAMLHTFYEKGWSEKDLSGIVMSGFIQKGSVAAYLTKNDENRLVAQLEFESKRNKAIILLALRLGLRDCDICNLTLSEIDWHNDRLRLRQKKTGEPLKLPLLPDVGNALMDYIVNERPRRNDNYPYVFLRSQAPYRKLSSVYQTCANLFAKLNIKPVNGDNSGVHIFRYSVAYRLLAAKVPRQVITDMLGHSSNESDKPYMSMDESMLKMCALDLTGIGSISWREAVYNG